MRQPTPENLAKLTEEQRKVYEAWVKEHKAYNELVEQALAALSSGNQNLASKYFDQLDQLIPDVCEHGRSIWSNCISCNEIEKILFPEDYDNDGERLADEILYKRTLN